MLTPAMAADDVRAYVKIALDQIAYIKERIRETAPGRAREGWQEELAEMKADLKDLRADLRRLEVLDKKGLSL